MEFSPDDVSALMDLMIRNHRVGAVCGRTRPMGAGPLVWYQIFDYAVGHWLLKVIMLFLLFCFVFRLCVSSFDLLLRASGTQSTSLSFYSLVSFSIVLYCILLFRLPLFYLPAFCSICFASFRFPFVFLLFFIQFALFS